MAVSWDNIKTILPNGNEVAYIFQTNQIGTTTCGPNQSNIVLQCTYLGGVASNTPNQPDGNSWGPGLPLEGLFPNVGEYVSINVSDNLNGIEYALCYKCLEIIDKNTFLTGTCTSCYDDGYGGNCSDVFITVPPYPGDPNGCRYDDSINPQGIGIGFFSGLLAGNYSTISYISPDCSDCTTYSTGPPTSTPLNFVQNCCDPSEQYQFSPTSSIAQYLNSVSSQSSTIQNLNAFTADLYISPNGNQGAQTGFKCWSVGTHLNPQLIPFAYSIATVGMIQNGVMVVYQNCQQLQNYLQLQPNMANCCGAPPTEWCCLTGVAGPPTTCTQVALGTCNPAVISNYSAGPFQSQQLCLAAGCATVADPPYECELPAAALINLQAKVKGFSDRRTQALSEPKSDPALDRAFKNTGISKISPGTKIKSDSGGGTTVVIKIIKQNKKL